MMHEFHEQDTGDAADTRALALEQLADHTDVTLHRRDEVVLLTSSSGCDLKLAVCIMNPAVLARLTRTGLPLKHRAPRSDSARSSPQVRFDGDRDRLRPGVFLSEASGSFLVTRPAK